MTRKRDPRPALANITKWDQHVEQQLKETKDNQDNSENATIVKQTKKGKRGCGMSSMFRQLHFLWYLKLILWYKVSAQRPAIAKQETEREKKEEIEEEQTDTFLGDLARTIGATEDDNESDLFKKLRNHVLSVAESGSNIDFATMAKVMALEQGSEHDLRLPNTTLMYIDTEPSIFYDANRDY